MTIQQDIAYLEMAYGLARRARGWTSPNPHVGAVIVNKGMIVGHGFHERPGQLHAEALALLRAGSKASGATGYITLEPCIHWGRTPPCVEDILKSKLKRVVVSALDPNPRVYRKGIQKLREAGISVDLGLLKSKNRKLNEAYIKYVKHRLPFVTAKAAISLDGKIATRTLSSKWISTPQAREYTHLLRGENDAIMVGINTLLQDDPRLTIRHPHWWGKRLTRVILDSRLRFPLNSRILKTRKQGRIIVFTRPSASENKAATLKSLGVEVIRLASRSSGFDLGEILRELAAQEISSVLVEGGGLLLTSLLQARLADKLFLVMSPKLIGGKKARSFFQGQGVDEVRNALRLKHPEIHRIGEDTIMEGYF